MGHYYGFCRNSLQNSFSLIQWPILHFSHSAKNWSGPRLSNPWCLLTRLSVQFNIVAESCPTVCDPINCRTPCFPVHHQLPKLAQTHIHEVDETIQPSHPLSSPFPPTFNHSQHQVFSNESVLCIRWPKYWSFSFSTSPSNEYSGLISFRMDWLDLLAVQLNVKRNGSWLC